MVIAFAEPNSISADGLEKLAQQINEVYQRAEGDLFCGGLVRTSRQELLQLVEHSNLLLFFGDETKSEDSIQGCMYLKKTDSLTASFGMLAIFSRRSQGLGRQLLDFAERWAANQGCTAIQLSLLSPLDRQHAHKQFLESWYCRRGYEPVKELEFNWPSGLTCPCDFRLFSKPLNDSENTHAAAEAASS